MSPMRLYTLGSHGQSNTDGKVLITVELVPNFTDMKGVTVFSNKQLITPFYRELKLNCGRIVRITDLVEAYDFTTATIPFHTSHINVETGKYFNIDNYDFSIDGYYISAYQFKVAAMQDSGYVAGNYNGVMYRHYESGNIKAKEYYKDGVIKSRFYHRDDMYNSLEAVRQYHGAGDQVECEFQYDEREALIKQLWFDSKGKIYHKMVHATSKRGSVPPEPESEPPQESQTDSEPEPEPPQESQTDSEPEPEPPQESQTDSDSEPEPEPPQESQDFSDETESEDGPDGHGRHR